MTQKTERFLRPEFGSNLMNYTFVDTGITMLNIMSREISKDILKHYYPMLKQVLKISVY